MIKNPKKRVISKSIKYGCGFLFNKALIGPYLLMLTVFNKCNMNYVFCAAHSPIINKKVKQEYTSEDYNLFRISWDNKKDRMEKGYSCDSCSFKMQNVNLDKPLRLFKPFKKIVTSFGVGKC